MGEEEQMNEECKNCKKAGKKLKEIMKESDSIFDAANDFRDFIEKCSKKCKKINQEKLVKEQLND